MIDDELDRVRATPPARARAEMLRAAGPNAGQPAVRRLLDDPADAVIELAGTMRRCWDTLLLPQWSRVRDVLDSDIAYRTRILTEGGMEALLADLGPAIRWADGRVLIESPADDYRDLAGQGLLLMPSVFNWPDVSATSTPWPRSMTSLTAGYGTT